MIDEMVLTRRELRAALTEQRWQIAANVEALGCCRGDLCDHDHHSSQRHAEECPLSIATAIREGRL